MFKLEADKDGRPFVRLRAAPSGAGYVVACEVTAAGPGTLPRNLGPYVLAGREQALAFLDETSRALTYLGCRVYDPVDASGHPEQAVRPAA